MAHDLERGAKEMIADLGRGGARRATNTGAPTDARRGSGIKLMTDHDTDRRPERAARHHADQATHRFFRSIAYADILATTALAALLPP